jgi:hypothetical protein
MDGSSPGIVTAVAGSGNFVAFQRDDTLDEEAKAELIGAPQPPIKRSAVSMVSERIRIRLVQWARLKHLNFPIRDNPRTS